MAELTKEQAEQELAKIRPQLNEWRDAYYTKDAPVVEDNVYDKLYNRLLDLEKAVS
jgi:NAD-dependent DNA ligase (contains BRCT domain type II)